MSEVIRIDRAKVSESPESIFERTKAREIRLSRLLVAYVVTGLVFMLLPGTFLGVWNLISITNHRAADSISATWIQAHGHAQIFGWVGTFILGIGFHSIPNARRKFGVNRGWLCFALWTTGVTLRWFSNVYLWQWQMLLPVSAILELSAFLIFFRAVSQHEPKQAGQARLESWVWIVVVATFGFLATLVFNLVSAIRLSLAGVSPAIPHELDQRFLVLCAWGFLVPFVLGFSSKWLPIFLGLRSPNFRALFTALVLNTMGVVAALFGNFQLATFLLLACVPLAIFGLKLFAQPATEAKITGVHASFPYFVRLAYGWLVIAAGLGVWASRAQEASGIWGASRHALTVGFIGVMIFSIGQRVLPAFSGMKLLFSPRLMFVSVSILTLGCTLRVSSEVLAYQEIWHGAWKLLPASAVLELTAVIVFAFNLIATFVSRPAYLQRISQIQAPTTLLRKGL